MNGRFANGNFKNGKSENDDGWRRIDSLYINIDGSSRGNPGPSAIGIVVKDNWGKTLEEYKEFLGQATNNFAEYKAAVRALELAMRYCRNKIYIFTDSKLLVNQLNGRYRIKKRSLMRLLIDIKVLEGFFKNVRWFHVNRERNVKADSLAGSALNNLNNGNQNENGRNFIQKQLKPIVNNGYQNKNMLNKN